MQTALTIEDVETLILDRLPTILEQNPRFVTFIEGIVAQKFPRRDEFARLLNEVQQHRKETASQFERIDKRFEQVDEHFERIDKRFDELEQKMQEGFHEVQVRFDRFGQRWGIRNESIFRQTMRDILEKSFGATVQERYIGGEQFDCVIVGDQHILVEISASVGKDILKKLQRKRQLYIDETGVVPARFILAVGTIHSYRAEALRQAGFDVIEPEDDEG